MIPRLNVGGFINNSSVGFPGFIWPDINPVNYPVEIDPVLKMWLISFRLGLGGLDMKTILSK
jgi:hypothetical protein